MRQVGAVPAPRLAAGRDGGPDAGQRPDPRRDDGRGRRLPRRARHAAVRGFVDRVLDFVIVIGLITTFCRACMGLVKTDIKRVVAYSTLNSLGLMMVALGFGDAGRRGDAVPVLPRLLQGAALPRLRVRDPRDRGPGRVDARRPWRTRCRSRADVPHRRAGDGGPGPALRLLGQGRDPRRRARTPARSSLILMLAHVAVHGALHVRASTCSPSSASRRTTTSTSTRTNRRR